MRLPPIEHPHGIKMRLAYAWSRRQLGKAITPLKVVYARVPKSLDLGRAMSTFLQSPFRIEKELVFLIETYTAGLNKCGFCVDIAQAMALRSRPQVMDKIAALPGFRTSPKFSARERAALVYVEAATRDKHVSDEVFATLQKHFSAEEIVEITLINAAENFYNMVNIPLAIESDGLCALVPGAQRERAAAASRG
jgi:alkylhydroperoxidase family enzyme